MQRTTRVLPKRRGIDAGINGFHQKSPQMSKNREKRQKRAKNRRKRAKKP